MSADEDPGCEDFGHESPAFTPEIEARSNVRLLRNAPEHEAAYVIETAEDIAAPLPPLEWLCQGLRLARSSITIVGGFGYSRKTLYAQSVALSIASGTKALGVYSVDHQPALHIDYEQGKRITRERYQRLARASGVELREAKLSVVTFPRFKLTSVAARDTLRRLLEETAAKFVVLDSLRAAMEGVEENSSEVRESIDLVGQELKRVDAAGIIIHHARKPTDGAKAGGRYSLRGSGAIFDACDSVFIFSGEKGQHTTVEHEKDRLIGTELPSYGLDSEDVERDGDARWGLRLVHKEAEEIRLAEENGRAASWARDRAARAEAVRVYLRGLPDLTWRGTRSDLAAKLGARKMDALATIGDLVSTGHIAETFAGRRTTGLRWAGGPT